MGLPTSTSALPTALAHEATAVVTNPWRPDQTHRVMQPQEFLARLAALVPPPRSPLIRFHGAIAPNFPHRAAVVALAPKANAERNPQACASTTAKPRTAEHERNQPARSTSPTGRRASTAPDNAGHARPNDAPSATCTTKLQVSATPGGALQPPRDKTAFDCDGLRTFSSAVSRIDWATLLRRVYDIDALACPCGGRLRFTDLVTDPDEARALLQDLGLPSEPPPILAAHAAPDLLDLPPPDD